MIGVLDSGLGGVLTAEYIQEVLPACSLLVFSDSKYVPYGERSPQRIHDRTFTCLHWLFDQGCSLVILACNTASTHAIVEWQATYPEKKVLSVTVPGVEAVIEYDLHRVGVLATDVTAKAGLYTHMFKKHYKDYPMDIQEIGGGRLVKLIEMRASEEEIEEAVQEVIGKFDGSCDGFILGCTHYPLIVETIKKQMDKDTIYIDPGKEAAKKLPDYLKRHPELADKLCDQGEKATSIVTTGSAAELRQKVATLLGQIANERDCLAVEL